MHIWSQYRFLVDLQNYLHNFQGDTIIIGGNFNFVFNLDLDKVGGGRSISFKARKACLALMSTFDLIDIWREKNPLSKILHGVPMSHLVSTVDYILLFSRQINSNVSVYLSPCNKSDHSFVKLAFNIHSDPRGPGY
ncbi:hypothetical protein HOLleu_31964 [Holothuria leucospilota]|uniref:Endonuclease/exonuclease/phosphatase domain-containing protein n=1 Tax=Holothuria leucospilota TaxID=206669 RepID=A0A9Q1BII3_HOLLE|nr:hypothetical protein HOLleu_31964 [Holothuria leucospilota]